MDERGHFPVELQDDLRFATKGEVCWGCSDPFTGHWVPVSFCATALAASNADEYNGTHLTERGRRVEDAFYSQLGQRELRLPLADCYEGCECFDCG